MREIDDYERLDESEIRTIVDEYVQREQRMIWASGCLDAAAYEWNIPPGALHRWVEGRRQKQREWSDLTHVRADQVRTGDWVWREDPWQPFREIVRDFPLHDDEPLPDPRGGWSVPDVKHLADGRIRLCFGSRWERLWPWSRSTLLLERSMTVRIAERREP